MRILGSDELSDRMIDVVHLETQAADLTFDLSVAAIGWLSGSGSVDFGGSEYEEADRERLEPNLMDADDDYKWWELAPGGYVLTANEGVELDEGEIALVHPHHRLLMAGAYHPAFVLTESQSPVETLIVVSQAGCRLKENCRVSRLTVLEA